MGLETAWLIDAGWRLAWPGAMLKDFFEPHLFLIATEDESVLIQGLVLQTVKKPKFVACWQGSEFLFHFRVFLHLSCML